MNNTEEKWPEWKRVKFPRETYATGDYRVAYEIIDNRIVHSIGKGFYSIEDVNPNIESLRRVCAHVEQTPRCCYFINGLSKTSTASRTARLKYLDEIKHWHADFPHFKMMIFYGVNRWIKAGIHLAKHMVPFKVKIVDDLESALAYIKVRESAHSRPDAPDQDTPLPSGKAPPYPDQPHEILKFLGNISWGSGNPDIPDPPPQADSAFGPVYDAISLIKRDLDELEKDRQQSETQRLILATAIEQSTDSITITNATGNILYVNPAFTRITGYTQAEAAGRPIAFISQDREAITTLRTLLHDVTLDSAATQQITCHKKDETPYLADTTVSQIVSNDGETKNFVTVQRNVTHEVQLEAQLKQIHKMEAIGTSGRRHCARF